MYHLTEAPGPPLFKYETEFQHWLATHPDRLESKLWIVAGELELDQVERHRVDLLGVDGDGHLVVIEVKRANATREAVGQVLDYVSALEEMEPDEIANLIETASAYGDLLPVPNFGRQYADRFDGTDLSMLTPARIMLASTSATPATERILRYLRNHDVDAESHPFKGYMKDGKRVYRRKRSTDTQRSNEIPSEPRQRELEANEALQPKELRESTFPGVDSMERSKIRSVHARVSQHEHVGGDLFRAIHAVIVQTLPDAHELAREEHDGRHGRLCCGIAFTMKATSKDQKEQRTRRGNQVEHVTIRLYPEDWPGKIRIQLFGRAMRCAGEHATLLGGLPDFDPEGGRNRGKVDGCDFWFTAETWLHYQANFEAALHAIHEGWKAEREAGI